MAGRKNKSPEPTEDDWKKAALQVEKLAKDVVISRTENELPLETSDPNFRHVWEYEKPKREYQRRNISPSDMDTCPFKIGSRIFFYEISEDGTHVPVNALVVGLFYDGFAYVRIFRKPIGGPD